MIKKISLVLFLFLGFFCLKNISYAEMNFPSYVSFTQWKDYNLNSDFPVITSNLNDTHFNYFFPDPETSTNYPDNPTSIDNDFPNIISTVFPGMRDYPLKILVVEVSNSFPNDGTEGTFTYTDLKNSPYYISEKTITWGGDLNFWNDTGGGGISILGGTAPSNGSPVDGTSFISGITASVGSTLSQNGLSSPLVLVIGFILTFILLSFFIKTFKKASEIGSQK